MVINDLNCKQVAKFDRYIGNYLFYPVDEYTMLYSTFGAKNRVMTHTLGHIDLRTGKDVITIDGLIYCTVY